MLSFISIGEESPRSIGLQGPVLCATYRIPLLAAHMITHVFYACSVNLHLGLQLY